MGAQAAGPDAQPPEAAPPPQCSQTARGLFSTLLSSLLNLIPASFRPSQKCAPTLPHCRPQGDLLTPTEGPLLVSLGLWGPARSESPSSRPQLLSLLLWGRLFPQPLDQGKVKADPPSSGPQHPSTQGQARARAGALRLRLSLVALSSGMRGAGCGWVSVGQWRRPGMALADQAGAVPCSGLPAMLAGPPPFEGSHAACTRSQQPACHGLLVVPGEAWLS